MLYAQFYMNERREVPKSQDNMRLLLDVWKVERPEIFRSYLRVSPRVFDELVEVIKDDPAFHTNSNRPQLPVRQQLAIALYRFGHFGNAGM